MQACQGLAVIRQDGPTTDPSISKQLSSQRTMRQDLWLYWDDGFNHAPPIIQFCIYTIIVNSGCQVRLLDKASYLEFFNVNDPTIFSALRPAHQADLVRIHALADHGGMYIDCDTVVAGSLRHLFQLLFEHEYVAGSYHNPRLPEISGDVGITILGPALPGLHCLRSIRHRQLELLTHHADRLLANPWRKSQPIEQLSDQQNRNYPISWLGLLDMVDQEFRRHPPDMHIIDGYSSWYSYIGSPTWPEGGKWGHVFRDREAGEAIPRSDLYTFSWSGAPSTTATMAIDVLMNSNWILTHLLRMAGISGDEDISAALANTVQSTRSYLSGRSQASAD